MKSFLKFLLGLAGFACVAGIILAIIGLCMGGRPTNIQLRWNGGSPRLVYSDLRGNTVDGKRETHASRPKSAASIAAVGGNTNVGRDGTQIRGLSLDIGAAAVTITRGDAYGLTVMGDARYTDTIDEGIWEIESETDLSTGFTKDTAFHITIPHAVMLDELEISLGAGKLDAAEITCQTADIEVGAGTITLTDFSCINGARFEVNAGSIAVDGTLSGKTRINCALGDAKLTLDRPANYGYDVDCGLGMVRLDGNSFSGLSNDVRHNSDATDFYKINCDVGNVDISFTE